MANRTIREIFSQVPRTYERINHVLTFGMDMLWRRRAARIAVDGGGTRWLDVCSGTGEMAAELARKAPGNVRLFAADFSLPMLVEARRKPEARRIRFSLADVRSLPYPDGIFDLITISFATRNLHQSRDVLCETFAEFRRVLNPGGRFVNLETSQPQNRIIRSLFHGYIRLLVRRVGSRLSGSNAGYAYLAGTIPRFYDAESLSRILKESGFADVRFRRLFFGAAAIHVAENAADADRKEKCKTEAIPDKGNGEMGSEIQMRTGWNKLT